MNWHRKSRAVTALDAAGPEDRSFPVSEAAMLDLRAHLEKLRSDAENCALISQHATDAQKRELFARLSQHLNRLAGEVERVLAEKQSEDGSHPTSA